MSSPIVCGLLVVLPMVLFMFCTADDPLVPDVACPEVFAYAKGQPDNEYYGEITLHKPSNATVLVLEVNMTVNDALKKDDNLKISLLSSQEEVINGDVVKYAVKLPIQNPLAKITRIKYNDKVECNGAADPLKGTQTAMWAKTTLKMVSS